MLAAETISSVLEVLGATLPFAVGMLLSPFPIIAALLVLLSPSGRAGGLAFSLGRFVGVALVATAASLLAEVLTLESGSSVPSAILRILLGVALLGLAVVKWRRRPEMSEELPKWMSSVERRSPRGAAGLGFVLSVANPKELAFSIGAGLTIGAAAFPPGPTVGLAVGYTVIACLSVIAPTLAFVVNPDRMTRPLQTARTWLVQRNNTIITVVFVIIGAVLVGDGIGQL
jgi:threonine/homoserine/homoserine lactone efflux protein